MTEVIIKIPQELHDKIEYYRKINHRKKSFEQYVLTKLKFGLNEEIHKTIRKEKESILCPDTNPKTSRLTFDHSHVFEYFVCDQCRKDHKYNDPTHEESIDWK